MSNEITTLNDWSPNQPVVFAPDATAQTIAAQAKALSERDIHSIAQAFNAGSYEMVSTFVWARAITGLRKQVGSLGMEFVGQMLGRPDIDEYSDPVTQISEPDAISLAEDLGMVTTTEALRLKHSMELVHHFSDAENSSQDQMNQEEAVSILRSCVATILGNPHIKPPLQFADLRKALGEESLLKEDERVEQIAESPYFIQRTTLSVLLSLLKSSRGAQLEHAVGNTNIVLPRIWSHLRQPERWQVGQAYAEVHTAGKKEASAGLKNALATVKGFDYVPETLRSDTFARAAHKVIEAHNSVNNYYKETAPIEELAALGTTIPRPAFPVCMQAILCVRLGNFYGFAWAAQETVGVMLQGLRKEQWEYYLNECLLSDKTILDKLQNEKPADRWVELASEFELTALRISDSNIKALIDAKRPVDVQRARKRIRPSRS